MAQMDSEKADLIVDEQTYTQRLELLRYQVNEIQSVGLDPESEAALEQEFQRAAHLSQLSELSGQVLYAINEQESSLWDTLGTIGRHLESMTALDANASELSERHQHLASQVHDLEQELTRYTDKLEMDPARLAELEERIGLIQSLKRKYGPSLEDVVRFGTDAAKELDTLESREETLAQLEQSIEMHRSLLLESAAQLTAARNKCLSKIRKAVVAQLRDLGFLQSRFEVQMTTQSASDAASARDFASSGLDKVDFQFGPNPGEPMRPLNQIASSGEMARVMLALKNVLAEQDRIPVLIFDEVDANVGGEIATVVGRKMKEIGEKRQVLCITHLPPVAAQANHHFLVQKVSEKGRTNSIIEALEPKERITEIARMLGGASKAALGHAKSMLSESGQC